MTQHGDEALLDLIYDAIVDTAALSALTGAIAAATGSDCGWLLGDLSFGNGPPGQPAISHVHGVDDDVVRAYQAAEYLRDPWMEAGTQIGMGVATSMARFVDESTFRASAMHNEFLRGRADVLHCMTLAVPVDGQILAYAVQRGATGRAYDRADEARFDLLAPHLARLLRARHLRARNGITSPNAFDAVLMGVDAVFLCDEDARIGHLNVPAADLLTQRRLFHQSPAGRLEASGGGLNLHHAVRDALARGIPTLHVAIHHGVRWMIRVDPASDGSRTAVVLARDVAAHIARQVDTARMRFDLTTAEAKLAASLANGLTVEDHARLRAIKMPTVRSQMSALLAKSGCERQAQFVAAIHEMPPARH